MKRVGNERWYNHMNNVTDGKRVPMRDLEPFPSKGWRPAEAVQIAVIVQVTETGQSLTCGLNPSPFAYLGKSTHVIKC